MFAVGFQKDVSSYRKENKNKSTTCETLGTSSHTCAIISLFQQHLGWLVSALIQTVCLDDTESVLLPLFKDFGGMMVPHTSWLLNYLAEICLSQNSNTEAAL